jgi:bifunctional UDP-N-acetylglucosamine pyrophosphorylase/glucosamine-1-phosphate N-acetyltransferase
MLPVADRPLVDHVADAAVDAGADEFVVVVGYRADVVRDHFGDSHGGVPVRYATQDEQRGTAHAVLAAREYLDDGPFAVLNGDTLANEPGIRDLFDAGPAVAVHRVTDPVSYGVVATDGDHATGITEKPDNPSTDLANAGAYVFPAAAQGWFDVRESERGELELTDVLARTIDSVDVTPVELERWLDVGRPWELLAANEWKLGDLDGYVAGDVSADADLRGTVVVEEDAVVEPGVVIEGPALVRSGAHVGPNAYVRGATLLGEGTEVGHAVELKNSIVMRDTNVPHLSYVGDSVLGPGVNFGAGTQVANLRHDDRNVKLTVKGERVSTGRRKFGVVVGPGAKTGVNTSLAPGVTLSADARTDPGGSVLRDR